MGVMLLFYRTGHAKNGPTQAWPRTKLEMREPRARRVASFVSTSGVLRRLSLDNAHECESCTPREVSTAISRGPVGIKGEPLLTKLIC